VIEGSDPWFAENEEGEQARALARVTLAKGQTIVLEGDTVGLKPGSVPDRFRSELDPNGVLRNGCLQLGLSDPLTLTVTIDFSGEQIVQQLMLYRVPALPGDSISYAGAYHGTVLALNLVTERDPGHADIRFDGGIDVTLFMGGEQASHAVRGLGFARAFGHADSVLFECPGLLPEGGVGSEGRTPPGAAAEEVWQVAAVLGGALAQLEKRDGRVRTMPSSLGSRELALAETVLQETIV
jgi:hypothetical protein